MQTDEQAIRELITTWLTASKAGDTAKVLSLMSDDVVFLGCGRAPMRGKAAFAAGQTALSEIDIDATSEIQEITIVGDWAYIWTQLTVVMTPKSGGDANKRTGHTLTILQKQNGKWLLVRDANMLGPAR
jgi:uncharacterized protein (TIGR02246 family)